MGGKKEKLFYTDVFSATESQIQKKKLQDGFELNHAKLNDVKQFSEVFLGFLKIRTQTFITYLQ